MLASRAAVIIQFEVRMTLFSKLLLLRLQFANSFPVTLTSANSRENLFYLNSVRHLEHHVHHRRGIHRLPGS